MEPWETSPSKPAESPPETFGYWRLPGTTTVHWHNALNGERFVVMPKPTDAQLQGTVKSIATAMRAEHMAGDTAPDRAGKLDESSVPPLEICEAVLVEAYQNFGCNASRARPCGGASGWARRDLMNFILTWKHGNDSQGASVRYAHYAPMTRGVLPDGSMLKEFRQFVIVPATETLKTESPESEQVKESVEKSISPKTKVSFKKGGK